MIRHRRITGVGACFFWISAAVLAAAFGVCTVGHGAVAADSSDAVDLLADHSMWKPAGSKRAQSARWDKKGNLVLGSEGVEATLQCSYGRRQPLMGATVRLDMRFLGSPSAATNGGVLFEGVATARGAPLAVVVTPESSEIRVGDAVRKLTLHDENPYFLDLEMKFGESSITVFWSGKPVDAEPIAYLADKTVVVVQATMGTVSIERLSLTPSASSPTTTAREYSDVSLEANGENFLPLASSWADYFGVHYARSPEMAGIEWNTVRSYGGPHIGIPEDPAERDPSDPVLKGPFTGKDVRVSLRDFHAPAAPRRELMTAEEILPQLIEHQITDINLINNIAKPTMEPFDKDLVYWTLRLMYDQFPEARNVLCWEMGNEIVSGHFDPKGLRETAPRISPDGKVFGYDIAWKCDYYVNRFLGPAVEATERAAQDAYGDPRAVRVLVGSMNPYNDYNLEFLKMLMDSTFDGKEAPSLKGDPTWKHFDYLNVHYMTGSDATMQTLQDYLEQYVQTGKVKGIWDTEDHGGGGKGPATVADRGLRFLAWAAKNGLSADQTRIVWYGIGANRAGGNGEELAIRLGRFLEGKRLFFLEKRYDAARFDVIADAADGAMKTILVAVLPEASAPVDLGALALELPAGVAERDWKADATQYSTLVPPENAPVSLSREGAKLRISVSRRIAEPFLIWLDSSKGEAP